MSWMKSGAKISRNGLSDADKSELVGRIIGTVGEPIREIKTGWYLDRLTGVYFKITEVDANSYLQLDAINKDPSRYPIKEFYDLSKEYYYFGENIPECAELREGGFGDLVYFAKGVL